MSALRFSLQGRPPGASPIRKIGLSMTRLGTVYAIGWAWIGSHFMMIKG